MTLHFQTKPLREALASLQPVLSSKNSLPVLGAVGLDVFGKHCELVATNLDTWSKVHVPMTMTGDGPDQIRVPGRLLHEALTRLSEEECKIETNQSHAVLTAGRARLSLPLVIDPLPPVPEAEWGKPIVIDQLQDKLRRALPFVGKKLHMALNMAVHLGEGKLEACDGRRFIGIKDKHCSGGLIVPTELCQLVARTEGAVAIRSNRNLVEFAGEDWTITGKLLESASGAWMNTDSMYNRKTAMTVKSSARELIEAASLAAFCLPSMIDSVSITAHEDRLTFAAKGENPTEVSVPAEVDLPQPVAGVSAAALETALRAVTSGGNDEVTLHFSDCHSFSVSHDGTTVVCMLTRL